jgi:hypothetical protein
VAGDLDRQSEVMFVGCQRDACRVRRHGRDPAQRQAIKLWAEADKKRALQVNRTS